MLLIFLIPIVLAVILFGSWYAYRIAFFSPEKGRDEIPQTNGNQYDPFRPRMRQMYRNLADRPCEFVTIKSHDGLTLSARYYHVAEDAPLAICFHGYKSHALTDFSGGCELSFTLGHNILLVDQRAHGKSQGKTITYGILERKDLLRWVHYATDRFGTDIPILLYGISMGGDDLHGFCNKHVGEIFLEHVADHGSCLKLADDGENCRARTGHLHTDTIIAVHQRLDVVQLQMFFRDNGIENIMNAVNNLQ